MKKLLNKFLSIFNKKEGNENIQKTTAKLPPLKWILLTAILIVGIVTWLSPSKKQAAQKIYESDLKNRGEYQRIDSQKYVNLKEEIQRNNAHPSNSTDPFYRGSKFGRKFNAAQVVENNDESAFKIPPGSLIRAALVNKLISNTLNQPVIAIVKEDYYLNGSLAITKGSRLLGRATHDERARRIQIKFDTVIDLDDSSRSFSGLALDLQDSGSSGLSGKYHSQKTTRIGGSLLSYFISGMADGLQDKATTLFGISQEGSIKNGALEGVSRASVDQAKRLSDSLETVQGYIEIDSGYEFLVYLDREFQYE